MVNFVSGILDHLATLFVKTSKNELILMLLVPNSQMEMSTTITMELKTVQFIRDLSMQRSHPPMRNQYHLKVTMAQ
jgi:hypothetical protein